MQKNVASQKIQVFAFNYATGAPKTGDAANITVYESLDYGAPTVLTDTSASEANATAAPGWYVFDLTQAETNANEILFTGISATANISVVGRVVVTVPAAFVIPGGNTGGFTIAGTNNSTTFGNLTVSGAVTLNTVTSNAVTVTDLTISGNANVSGNVRVTGTTTFTGLVTGNISGNMTGSVGNVNSTASVNVISMAAGVLDATQFTAAAENAFADALLDRSNAIETAITPRLALRYTAAASAGNTSGMETTTAVLKGAGVTTTRITATVDADGNRSGIVLS